MSPRIRLISSLVALLPACGDNGGGTDSQTGGTTAPTITQGFLTNLGVTGAAGSIAYSILHGSSLLDVELSALQQAVQVERAAQRANEPSARIIVSATKREPRLLCLP